jgi:hypothetical protein
MGHLSGASDIAFGRQEHRSPTHGYAATREAAMAAFGKSWRGGVTRLVSQDEDDDNA